jgi:transcriptional regulator with XRE-family HTH domain
MNIGSTIRRFRENYGFSQKHIAIELGIGITNYNKIESGVREPTVRELQKLAMLFRTTIDNLVNYEESFDEFSLLGRPAFEQLAMINQLDREELKVVSCIVSAMLFKKEKNVLNVHKQKINGESSR